MRSAVLNISYETARRWFLKFGVPIARNLRCMRPTPSDYWHLDEMVIVIRRRRFWLWRAVDNEGEVLDFLVQPKRNAKAALKLMRKLLKKHGWAPTRLTTDKLRSYRVAIRTLGLTSEHIDNKACEQSCGELASASATERAQTAAIQVTGLGPTLPEPSIRRIQYLLRPASFTQQNHVQAVSNRRVQCVGKCERGNLKGRRCSPLRPSPVNVTMPENQLGCGRWLSSSSPTFRRLLRPDLQSNGEVPLHVWRPGHHALGFWTGILGEENRERHPGRRAKVIDDNVPMRRVGEHEEPYGPLHLLASSAGSYIRGEILVVDGGLTVGRMQ